MWQAAAYFDESDDDDKVVPIEPAIQNKIAKK
jgi:hypothetical protein